MKKSQLKQLIREVINEIHGLPESEILKNWAKKNNPDIDVVDFTQWAMKKYNFKTAEELDKKIEISYEDIPDYVDGDRNRPNVHGNYERESDHFKFLSRIYSGYEKDVKNKTWIPRAQR
jgi:hypothetical protein